MEYINQLLARLEVAPLVGAVIIAVVTAVAARVTRVLGRKTALVLSRWSGLGISSQLFQIIRRPLWISVLLLGVLVEVQWLMPPQRVNFLVTGAAQTGLAIIWIIVLGRTMSLTCVRLTGYYPGAAEFIKLSENIGLVGTAIVGALMIMAVWQVNLTPFLASAGIAGIIVGLAAKDTLANFFGGISVFLDRPFKPGDYIVLSSGERGKVVDIGLRSTRIITRDDVLIVVPNSVMVSTKIVNESAPDPRIRVRIKVSVAYASDVDQVEGVLLEVARANPLVLSEPEPRVRFRSFGDSSLDFELLCWTAYPRDRGMLIHELNSAVFKAFNQSGIVFPFPQRDIYVHNVLEQTRH
jgi:MscS family membrane protein